MLGLLLLGSVPLVTPANQVNSTNLITEADYPRESRTEGAQGRTRVRVSVNSLGKQYRCEILTSSGLESIDKASCAVVMKKAIFEPARDELGVPIVGQIFMNLNWRVNKSRYPRATTVLPDVAFSVKNLPDDAQYALVTLSVLVDLAGSMSHCSVVVSSGIPAIDTIACPTFLKDAVLKPALDETDMPTKSVQLVRVAFAPSESVALDPAAIGQQNTEPASEDSQ